MISLTIECGGRTRRMTAAGMAILFGLRPDAIENRVTWYLGLGRPSPAPEPLHAQSDSHDATLGEGGKGGMGNVHVNVERKDIENVSDVTLGEARGEEAPAHPALSLAEQLAAALSDPASLRCYERLTTIHPRTRLERALELTLAVPAARLTKSRAAYFMGIVRMLAKEPGA